MAEYIEKYDAYKMVYDFQHERLKNGQVLISLSELREITFRIPALPTIDIVHCSECIHRREFEEYNRTHNSFDLCVECEIDKKYHDDDWFCADGERRAENE